MFKHGFADDSVLALKVDGKAEYAFLVNENKIPEFVNSIEQVGQYLEMKYISKRDGILEAAKLQVVQNNEEENTDIEDEDEDKSESVSFLFACIVILLILVLGSLYS
ncbi:hypothetical protein [Labilibaculum sp.]|uniref:hypothetical protein n=1 Tax=Labilibaculum sp. TaxID=2060723 RepID=UPI0035634F75